MGKVVYKKENGIAWLVLNRPDKRNAIDEEVMDNLKIRIDQAKEDHDVKCLVITGYGDKAFCSGGDLSVFHKLRTAEEAEGMLGKMGQILYNLFTLPKPTLAVLNGTTVGGGCEIAAACDYRLARAGITLGFIQGALGITTGWGGASFLFERLPRQNAFSLLTTAQRISAEDARQLGFINKVISDPESVEQAVHELVPLSQAVLSTYKMRFLDAVNLKDLRYRLENEIKDCAKLWEMDEHIQAVNRFLLK